MFLQKEGFPEEGELVLCTVTKIHFHSVFVRLDEYNKSGLIHISEVSPGRIRNMRDFVVEGKKVVCKVIRINKEKGYIDLSLRRVNANQQRKKISEIKLEQKAEKIVEQVAKKLNTRTEELYVQIMRAIKGRYAALYPFFEDISFGKASLKELKLDPKIASELETLIKQRIKEAEVNIGGHLKLSSFSPNGVEVIRAILQGALEKGKPSTDIRYEGGGLYKVRVPAKDYKSAETVLKNVTDFAIEAIKKGRGTGEFVRKEAA